MLEPQYNSFDPPPPVICRPLRPPVQHSLQPVTSSVGQHKRNFDTDHMSDRSCSIVMTNSIGFQKNIVVLNGRGQLLASELYFIRELYANSDV